MWTLAMANGGRWLTDRVGVLSPEVAGVSVGAGASAGAVAGRSTSGHRPALALVLALVLALPCQACHARLSWH